MGRILQKVYITQFFLSLLAGLSFSVVYSSVQTHTQLTKSLVHTTPVLAETTAASTTLFKTPEIAAEQILITPAATPVSATLNPTPTTTPLSPLASTASLVSPASPITPSQTPSPTPTVTPTPTITISSQVLSAEIVAEKATPTPTPDITSGTDSGSVPANPGGLNPDVLFNLVQAHRTSMGLPQFQKDDRLCSLAASRAPEVDNEVATGTMHAGLRARNLPYWDTENIITMNSEQAAFTWWINDTIHREAIEGDAKYSCLACSGNACAEEFSNFQPK